MTLGTMPSDPIVEALFEIRFSSTNSAISSLLLGAISNSSLGDIYHSIDRTNIADIPLPIRRNDNQLRYHAEYRLRADDGSISVGNSMIGVNVHRKYPGGEEFLKRIRDLIQAVSRHTIEMKVERVAFRYINLIEPIEGNDSEFDAIKFEGSLMNLNLKEQKTFLQVELVEDDCCHNVKLTNRAEVTNNQSNEQFYGLLLDIDTFTSVRLDGFWAEYEKILVDLRASERAVFEKIMKKETLDRYRNDVNR